MDVIIIGAGGHGKVVLEILQAAGKHRAIGFLDSDPSLAGNEGRGLTGLRAVEPDREAAASEDQSRDCRDR